MNKALPLLGLCCLTDGDKRDSGLRVVDRDNMALGC